jgi:hypothetical protein
MGGKAILSGKAMRKTGFSAAQICCCVPQI